MPGQPKPRTAAPPPPVEGCVWIPLTRDMFALVDNIDSDLLMFHWQAFGGGRWSWYAARGGKKRGQLHRIIGARMGIPASLQVDHENRNGLDCRRENLRGATPRQNTQNSRAKVGQVGVYKGVTASGNRWAARICVDGKPMFLAQFETREEAARCYDEAARKHFGAFAFVNFPEQVS
jgi:hypothetical protein